MTILNCISKLNLPDDVMEDVEWYSKKYHDKTPKELYNSDSVSVMLMLYRLSSSYDMGKEMSFVSKIINEVVTHETDDCYDDHFGFAKLLKEKKYREAKGMHGIFHPVREESYADEVCALASGSKPTDLFFLIHMVWEMGYNSDINGWPDSSVDYSKEKAELFRSIVSENQFIIACLNIA
jgi:hypothetical protein